ncbi:MAG TPA: 3-deoxy-manno-octulosonate cytidylyltransferase, partial [bacterium]|nr:3-deoxy-manno-octulosonate cytidylyltransferase [bacterium]
CLRKSFASCPLPFLTQWGEREIRTYKTVDRDRKRLKNNFKRLTGPLHEEGETMNSRVIAVIPARLGSERMPGKVLYTLAGKTLLQHTYEHACRVKSLSAVYIATDSEKIAEIAAGFGAPTIMTSATCRCGSDRVAEAARKLPGEIIVNIQADEPFLPAEAVEKPLAVMMKDHRIGCATAATRIRKKEELYDTNVVKVVCSSSGEALYFSRSLIPFPRVYFNENNLTRTRQVIFYKHIGVYLFRRKMLLTFNRLDCSPLEKVEKLEQLRLLENGYPVKVVIIKKDSPCVDTLTDLQKLENNKRKTGPNGIQA